MLYRRLTESGWCDQVRMLVRLRLKENKSVSLNELIDSTLPKARGTAKSEKSYANFFAVLFESSIFVAVLK